MEANYLIQQLSLITKAVTFFGAFIMMLFYSPLMTAIAAALTVLPFIAGAYFALNGYGLTPGAVILFVNLMNFTIEPIASLPGLLAGRQGRLTPCGSRTFVPASASLRQTFFIAVVFSAIVPCHSDLIPPPPNRT